MHIELLTSPNEKELLQLSSIEEACFAHPLMKRQIRSLTETQNAIYFAARMEDDNIVGSVWLQTVLDEGYIGNVAVLPSFRRQGVADMLLQEMQQWGRRQGLRFLTLEVRASNAPAIALYEKNGYTRVGNRRNYYTEPKEDAILMTLEFK